MGLLDIIKNYFAISFILLVLSYMTPKEEYRKYISFLVGVIMTMLVLGPVINLFNGELNLGKIEGFDELCSQLEDISFDEYKEYGAEMD